MIPKRKVARVTITLGDKKVRKDLEYYGMPELMLGIEETFSSCERTPDSIKIDFKESA